MLNKRQKFKIFLYKETRFGYILYEEAKMFKFSLKNNKFKTKCYNFFFNLFLYKNLSLKILKFIKNF